MDFLAARRGGDEVGAVGATGAFEPFLLVCFVFGGRPRDRFACDGAARAAGAGGGEAARVRFPDLPDCICFCFAFAPADAGAEVGLLGLPRLG
jgi:hypothetical protein